MTISEHPVEDLLQLSGKLLADKTELLSLSETMAGQLGRRAPHSSIDVRFLARLVRFGSNSGLVYCLAEPTQLAEFVEKVL